MAFNFDRREVNRNRFADKIRTRTAPKANRVDHRREMQQIKATIQGVSLDVKYINEAGEFSTPFDDLI